MKVFTEPAALPELQELCIEFSPSAKGQVQCVFFSPSHIILISSHQGNILFSTIKKEKANVTNSFTLELLKEKLIHKVL